MPLPTLLSRQNKKSYKNTFGHLLILAGSQRMLGATALCGLSAMRSGAGLVTLGIPQSLNLTVQSKISNVIMTLPLQETQEGSIAFSAFNQVEKFYSLFDGIAIGPGLSLNSSTQKFIRKIILTSPKPLVIDADALNALQGHLDILKHTSTVKILTPHLGEMERLTGLKKTIIEKDRTKIAIDFAQKNQCVLLLKGDKTLVVDMKGKKYVNTTGNSGMATAGSGDVLTGIITAFVGQGLEGFQSAKYGAYIHGKAGDLASQSRGRISMIATDIIENISSALNSEIT